MARHFIAQGTITLVAVTWQFAKGAKRYATQHAYLADGTRIATVIQRGSKFIAYRGGTFAVTGLHWVPCGIFDTRLAAKRYVLSVNALPMQQEG